MVAAAMITMKSAECSAQTASNRLWQVQPLPAMRRLDQASEPEPDTFRLQQS